MCYLSVEVEVAPQLGLWGGLNQSALGFSAGIYSSYYQWESIFGLDYTFQYAGEYPLWYAHYELRTSVGDFNEES